MKNRIPLMLDGCRIEAEYDYSTPEVEITGVYVAGRKVTQDDLIDALLDAHGINRLEDDIRDMEYTERAHEEFLTDNRWPDTWRL
jgi:hypothetical protein